MKNRIVKGIAIAATASILVTGCATDGTMTETGMGATIGSASEAALGQPLVVLG